MLDLPRGDTVFGYGLGFYDIAIAGDEDLKSLEQASCFGGLRAHIPNEHVRPDADLLQPLD